jgi:hypothetical protein
MLNTQASPNGGHHVPHAGIVKSAELVFAPEWPCKSDPLNAREMPYVFLERYLLSIRQLRKSPGLADVVPEPALTIYVKIT